MILAKQGIIPDKQYYHDPNIQNKQGYTVGMLIVEHCKQIPPIEWYHNPYLKNNIEETIFELLVQKQILPPKELCCQSEYQDHNGNTQAMILIKYNMNIPNYLYHNPEIQNKEKQTVAMLLAKKGILPPKQWLHNKFIKDNDTLLSTQQTVAEILAGNHIIPPKFWMITQDEDQQIFQLIKEDLQFYQLPIPKHIKDKELTIFDQAIYGQIPKLNNHKSDEQDEDGYTVAMLLVFNNIDIPKEWKHDPNIQNKYGMTVAMYQSKNGKIPDKQWNHNKYLKCIYRQYNNLQIKHYTVQNFLKNNNIKIPEQWRDDSVIDDKNNTQAMLQAKKKQIPDKKYYHNPEQVNIYGQTVAMILAYHGIIAPQEWCHDKLIKNSNHQTVAEILSSKGIMPPKQWMINEKEDEQSFKNIRDNLGYNKEYIFINQQFVPIWKTELLDDICQICFTEGQQEFIRSDCNKIICVQCFKELQRKRKTNYCPFCLQQNWYEKIYNNDNYNQ